MKTKKLSLLIFIVLLLTTICWLFIRNDFTPNHKWIGYILTVPLGFFSVMAFSRHSVEESSQIKIIIAITLGAMIPLFFTDFSFNLYIKENLSILLGAVITFFTGKFIGNKQ